jgi:hypothetical protein
MQLKPEATFSGRFVSYVVSGFSRTSNALTPEATQLKPQPCS